jgi:hypothetical protein
MSSYLDLKGTSESGFNIGLGSGAVSLQNSSSELHVKNKALSAFLNIKISELLSVSNQLTLNEDATLSGASWKMIIARPTSGMTSSVTYTLPAAPVNGYFLSTDASGNMNWTPISSPSTADKVATDSTSFSFSDFGSALSLFTLPANALVSEVQVIVDSAFDAGDVEIGLLGNLSKYMPTSASDLTDASQYSSTPTQIPVGTTEALIATFSGSPTSGTGRIVVFYSIPS